MIDRTDHDRLKEIRSEMMDLLDEAKNLIRMSDRFVYERAKAYWIGHIDTGLGGGQYVDTYDCTMEKTINELDPGDEDDEELEEENE
jgi:hypothetical protein